MKWLKKKDGTCSELVSCSADKTAAIWSLEEGTWTVNSILEGHGEGVTCIHGVYTSETDLVVYTGSIDSNVRVYIRCNGKLFSNLRSKYIHTLLERINQSLSK